MHRILGKEHQLKERQNQLRHPQCKKPELLAEKTHEVWPWDITKRHGPSMDLLLFLRDCRYFQAPHGGTHKNLSMAKKCG